MRRRAAADIISRNRWRGMADGAVAMTAPRRIVPGETYLVTRRCTRREYLLRPDEMTNEIFAYCLAEAAQRIGVGLVAWTAMSNHYHAVVYDPKGRLPAFLEHFHKMLSKALNARWGRWENLWSTEETCVTRLVTTQDIFDKILYVLCNPIADALVDRLSDWPGCSSYGQLDGKPKVYRRPQSFFVENGVMPSTVTLATMVPPRVLENEELGAWRARLREALASHERAIRCERLASRRPVAGRKAVLRARHTDAPATVAPKRRLRPAIACKHEERRIHELEQLKEFRARHRIARELWCAGQRRTMFPLGTYRMLEFGVRCAPLTPIVDTSPTN